MDKLSIMALDEVIAALIKEKCSTGDNACDHPNADDYLTGLLSDLGFSKTVSAYDDVGKWYE